MAEYIEREAVRNALYEADAITMKGVKILNQFQTADVVEVRHGEWEFIGDSYANCTSCGTIFEALPTKYFFELNNLYCRHCGAKMDGKGEGE